MDYQLLGLMGWEGMKWFVASFAVETAAAAVLEVLMICMGFYVMHFQVLYFSM